METQKKENVSNCMIMAKRLDHLQINVIGPKLNTALETMHDFFLKSYKGFYCTICDAD